MDYSKSWPGLDDAQKMLMDSIHQFAAEVVAPRAAHHDESGEFPTDTVKQMAEMGLMGMMVPEQWTAQGSPLSTMGDGDGADLRGLCLHRGHHVGEQLAGVLSHRCLWK